MTRITPDQVVHPKEAALLVIDVQRALFSRSTPIHNAEKLINNINTLIEKWEISSGLVIYFQHSNKKMLIKNTPDWELHPELKKINSGKVIHKLHGNAFEETNLKELLDSKGIKVTQGCIRATSIGARHLGYRVILVEDGHSNYSKDADKIINEWNLKLSNGTVELITAEKIVLSK